MSYFTFVLRIAAFSSIWLAICNLAVLTCATTSLMLKLGVTLSVLPIYLNSGGIPCSMAVIIRSFGTGLWSCYSWSPIRWAQSQKSVTFSVSSIFRFDSCCSSAISLDTIPVSFWAFSASQAPFAVPCAFTIVFTLGIYKGCNQAKSNSSHSQPSVFPGHPYPCLRSAVRTS